MVKIGPSMLRRRSTPLLLKCALLIGIDYTDAPEDSESAYPPLRRARSDTKNFRDLLISKYDYRPENIVMMLDEEGIDLRLWPTRANILREIRKLVQGVQPGSRCAFFYSGHSGQIESPTTEEDDGFDEFIVPVDHWQHSAGGNDGEKTKKRMILDNKLRKMLVDPLPVGSYLTAIFDSCHSGTLLDLDHYLCNNIYYPWQVPTSRRYRTMWQHVRRKDGQHMSQSGVRVITKKQRSDGKEIVGTGSTQRSREGSCSVRIYQRKRVSEDEIEVINTSVGVSDSQDGKRRQFSVQSRRRSIQCRASSSLALVMEDHMQSTDSVDDDGGQFGPRCSSPISIRTCSGFCDPTDKPPDGANVMSISSCHDSQLTFESSRGSFTHWLVELLHVDPHQPIGKFLHALTQKMYVGALRRHRYNQRMKAKWKLDHPDGEVGSGNNSGDNEEETGEDNGEMEETEETEEEQRLRERYLREHHPLDSYDFVSVGEPQLGAGHRVDLNQPINL